MTVISHILLRVNSTESGGMTMLHTNAGYQPSSEIDMAGRIVPKADLTRDEDTHSQVSDIPLKQFCIGSVSTSLGRPHAECSNSPSDTESDQGKSLAIAVSQYDSSGFTSSSRTSRNCPMVTERAREALKVQRETVRRALLHQQEEFSREAASREKLVSSLARRSEAHHYDVQMQVRQLEEKKQMRELSKLLRIREKNW